MSALVPNNFMGMFIDGTYAIESFAQMNMPAGGTVEHFYVRAQSSIFIGSITFTVRRNGVDTAVSCTMLPGSPVSSCSDTANRATFAAGDLISIGSVKSGSPLMLLTRWTAEFAP
ncbi:MAG TPA: hypothetical protein VFA66_06595 [Gaiellaceae bacterium]|nr:hypothetical protein [Gaiellaceae bacterium]